jgi:hypothetical protein
MTLLAGASQAAEQAGADDGVRARALTVVLCARVVRTA